MGNPVALVTGSSRGIGRGIAIELAGHGHDVVVNYAGNREAAEETRRMAAERGANAETVQGDVGSPDGRKRMIDTALERFGRLDLLVNNAGIAPKVRADILEMGEESYRHVMDTNLTGPFFLTQLAANAMIELRRAGTITMGRVVFITSISAYTASINRAEYCLSKAGLSMAVQLYADRLAPEDILVYEIRPGVIESDMTSAVRGKYDKLIAEGLTPQRRWGTAEDVGKAVAAVAGGYFDFSTGAVIDVDGGFRVRRL